jgi:hypothetical protein
MSNSIDIYEGLRGMPVYTPDGTQGVPARSMATSKRRGGDPDGWTSWDLLMARAAGLDRKQMAARRDASRAFVAGHFRECVEQLVADGAITPEDRDRFLREAKE